MAMWVEYTKICKIGEGAYGKVYKAQEKRTGNMYAVKVGKCDDDEGLTPSNLREIAQLKALNDCPNIVRLVGSKLSYTKSHKPRLYFIFELLDSDLSHYISIRRKKLIPATTIQSMAYQILKATAFCHTRGVIHRDLKTANILVDKHRSVVKVADFGIARFYTIPCMDWTVQVVTLWYRAPELLMGGLHYSPALDMWSVGCIIGEMVNKEPVFMASTETEMLQLIFRALGVPDEQSWPEVSSLPCWKLTRGYGPAPPLSDLFPTAEPLLLDLLSKMLVFNPARRISAKDAMEHPYFDGLDKSRC